MTVTTRPPRARRAPGVHGLLAAALGIEALRAGGITVKSLQEYAAEVCTARREGYR